jgi:prepilin-type N-terminal cleavage/methylation domain-containing protein
MAFKNEKGLTLIELLITIAVIAIVAAISIPVITNVIESSRVSSAGSMEAQVNAFIDRYNDSGAVIFDGTDTFTGYVDLNADGVVDSDEAIETFEVNSDQFVLSGVSAETVTSGATRYSAIPRLPEASVRSKPGGITSVAEITSWGNNSCGELEPPSLSNVVSLSNGSEFTVALLSDGTVTTWGCGTTEPPAELQDPATANIKQISAGYDFVVALKQNGSVVLWGYANPLPIGGISDAKWVSGGFEHIVVVKNDGTVVNHVTYGSYTITPPAQLTDPSTANVVKAWAGTDYTIALREDGSLISWGDNNYGLVTIPSEYLSPNTSNTRIVDVAMGYDHILALRADGVIVSWGSNYEGQRNIPADIQGKVIAIASGEYHSAALLNDGTVRTWGYIVLYNDVAPPTDLTGITFLASSTSNSYHFTAMK